MILSKLIEMFSSMMGEDFDVSSITGKTRLREDLCFSSLHYMWMAFAIQQEFNADLTTMDIGELSTVDDVVSAIETLRAAEK